MKRCFFCLCIWLLPTLLGGCVNLSPRYAPPGMEQPFPPAFKQENGWQTGNLTADLDRGSWWEAFGDPTLNDLMRDAHAANQDIAVAAANLRQARTQMDVARSALMPGFSLPSSVSRSGSEGAGPSTSYSYGMRTQWEISFWNALPAYEAAKAQAESTAAEYGNMRLVMQTELAQGYFQLRALDGQHDLYEDTLRAYKRAVELTRSQYRGGIATPADVAQAEAQLAMAEAQLESVKRQRAILENSIAVLTGKIASSFSLERAKLQAVLPSVPAVLPSSLLERRPDVAAAERMAAAANEQIGLARAAWLPTLNLGAEFLFQGASWTASPIYTWAVGPTAALSLFEGGRHMAETESAWAAYEAEIARYRKTVLQAFKDVEDNLGALRYLEQEALAQDRAVKASREALRLSMSQYEGGMTTYLQVVANQTTVLENERRAIDVQAQRLTAAVNLIKALGGGWQAADLERLAHAEPPLEGTASRQ